MWKIVFCDDCRITSFSLYPVYLPENNRNWYKLPINIIWAILIIHICKITFRKYTRTRERKGEREREREIGKYWRCIRDVSITNEESVYRRFLSILKRELKREHISWITSSSLIIIRPCWRYRIHHFYIFLYIIFPRCVLLRSFIATFHVCELLEFENNYYY